MGPELEKKKFSNQAGRILWVEEPGFSGLGPALSRALAEPGRVAAKRSRVREVIFLPPAEGRPSLVVKVYHARGPGALLRALCLGSPARRERRALRVLRKEGVAAPEPAALGALPGSLRLPTCSYLAMKTLENCCSLEDLLLKKNRPPVDRKIIARRTGHLIRGMHDAGVLHQDLHGANILVDPEGRPHILDLHSARVLRRLSPGQRWRDLCSLAGAFILRGTRTDRLRFFKAYASGSIEFGDPRDAAVRLEKQAREKLCRMLLRYDERALRPGRLFQSIQIHQLKGMAEPTDEAEDLLQCLGPYPRDCLDKSGSLIHKGNQTRVYSLPLKQAVFAVKCYARPGLWNQVKSFTQGSKARQSWLNFHRLRVRGLKAPKAVLYLEEPAFFPTGRSYVVTPMACDHETLDQHVSHATRVELARLLPRLACAIARMHRFYLGNRDLKAQNILVGPSGELLFIDPDGVESMKDLDEYVIARDLMRLNASFPSRKLISLADRLRFLKAYMRHAGVAPARLSDLWREILFLTLDKWRAWKK